jgi:hypothetical protein
LLCRQFRNIFSGTKCGRESGGEKNPLRGCWIRDIYYIYSKEKKKKKRRPFSTVHVVDDMAGESIMGWGARGAWALFQFGKLFGASIFFWSI